MTQYLIHLELCAVLVSVSNGNMENAYIDYIYSEERTASPLPQNAPNSTRIVGRGVLLGKRVVNKGALSKSIKSSRGTNPAFATALKNAADDRLTDSELEMLDAENCTTPKSGLEKNMKNTAHAPIAEIPAMFPHRSICGKNAGEGASNCKSICDIRNRQFIACVGEFCYCQSSYSFLNAAQFKAGAGKRNFFYCGRYDLQGYETCVEKCRRRRKATVQCGGESCYCHYVSLSRHAVATSVENLENRKMAPFPAFYCGQIPKSEGEVSFCKYRCPRGSYVCDVKYCYCL